MESITRRRLLAGFGSGTALVVAGCLTETEADSSSLTVAMADPLNNDYDFFDGIVLPHSPVAETLVYVTDELEAKPWLATDWESIDERTWQFTLRDNVPFHNGDELTAGLLETYYLAYDEERGLDVVEDGIRAVDEMVLEFELEEPNPQFPEETASHWMSIFHPESTREEVIATGPYQVDTHDIGGDVEASAFSDHWGGRPEFDAITVKDVQDDTTRRLELESGSVDVAVGIRSEHVDAVDGNPELRIETQEQLATFVLETNLYREPTDDRQFRRALQHIIDQDRFVEQFLEDRYTPASGLVPPYVNWTATDLPTYKYDLERADELVADSAYDGEEVSIAVRDETINGDLIAEAVQDRLDEIGVDSEIRLMENSAFLDFKSSGESQLTISSPSTLDANVLGQFEGQYHSEGISNIDVYRREGTGIHNPGEEVDDLIDASIDGDEDALEEVQHVVREEAVSVPLFHDRLFIGVHEDVEGVDLAPVSNQAQWGDVRPST